MGDAANETTGPDLTQGVAEGALADGAMLGGHVGDDAVLLARRGDEFFAIGAACTHYSGPLAEGLLVGDTVRCPWHHACFSLRTGEALRAPALAPVACWTTLRRDARYSSGRRSTCRRHDALTRPRRARRIVVVGGGAAGFAAAEMLRRQGYQGDITMLSDDDAPPVDRPNLSKDYLAGTAPEEWVPLRGDDFLFRQQHRSQAKGHPSPTRPRAANSPWATAPGFRTTGCCSRPEPSPCACRYRAWICRTSTRCARSPIAARSSLAPHREARRRHGRELHRSRGRGLAARPQHRRCTWWPRRNGRWSVCLVPSSGDFIRGLHEQHGVVFHLEETGDGDPRRYRRAEERRYDRRRSRRRRRRRASAACARPKRPASRSIAA
jgi:nitrite reductase/ring-hydroxylating ferredoxin subunit